MEVVLKDPKLYFDNDKICYRHISSHYWYANYGEFKVVIHKTVGYINVTNLCKSQGKHFKNWHANKSVKSMINNLAEMLAISPNQMLVTIEGGSSIWKKEISGTYAHPILLPHITSWLDHTFAAVASIMVNNFFHLQTSASNIDVLRQDEKPKKVTKGEEEGNVDADGESPLKEPIQTAFKIFRRNDDKFPYRL